MYLVSFHPFNQLVFLSPFRANHFFSPHMQQSDLPPPAVPKPTYTTPTYPQPFLSATPHPRSSLPQLFVPATHHPTTLSAAHTPLCSPPAARNPSHTPSSPPSTAFTHPSATCSLWSRPPPGYVGVALSSVASHSREINTSWLGKF